MKRIVLGALALLSLVGTPAYAKTQRPSHLDDFKTYCFEWEQGVLARRMAEQNGWTWIPDTTSFEDQSSLDGVHLMVRTSDDGSVDYFVSGHASRLPTHPDVSMRVCAVVRIGAQAPGSDRDLRSDLRRWLRRGPHPEFTAGGQTGYAFILHDGQMLPAPHSQADLLEAMIGSELVVVMLQREEMQGGTTMLMRLQPRNWGPD